MTSLDDLYVGWFYPPNQPTLIVPSFLSLFMGTVRTLMSELEEIGAGALMKQLLERFYFTNSSQMERHLEKSCIATTHSRKALLVNLKNRCGDI